LASVTVTQPDAGTVEVNVTYPFEFVTPMIAQLAGSGVLTMSGTASMIVQPPLVGGF